MIVDDEMALVPDDEVEPSRRVEVGPAEPTP